MKKSPVPHGKVLAFPQQSLTCPETYEERIFLKRMQAMHVVAQAREVSLDAIIATGAETKGKVSRENNPPVRGSAVELVRLRGPKQRD